MSLSVWSDANRYRCHSGERRVESGGIGMFELWGEVQRIKREHNRKGRKDLKGEKRPYHRRGAEYAEAK